MSEKHLAEPPWKTLAGLTGRANLRTARDNGAKELQRLQQAILAKAADEPYLREIEAKSQKLFEFLAPIDDSVTNKLDEAGRCTDPEKQDELNNAVRELIQLGAIRGHPLASFVQDNPFGKFIVRQPSEVTLSALDKQLSQPDHDQLATQESVAHSNGFGHCPMSGDRKSRRGAGCLGEQGIARCAVCGACSGATN